MRYSIIFFAALLGFAATTQTGELQDRDVQDIAASALQERAPFIRPPGWKGTGIPYPKKPLLHVPKVRPGRPKRLRNLEDLEERDLFEDSMSTLQERDPVIKPPGWKGIGLPYPKKPLLHVPKVRPSRPKRLRNLEELEARDPFEDSMSTLQERAPVMRQPGWKGIGIPYPKKPLLHAPKGRPARRIRQRGIEELERRVLQRRALPGSTPRRTAWSSSLINRPYKGPAAPRRRLRDV